MKAGLLSLCLLFSAPAFATDHCARYDANEKYAHALSVLAKSMGYARPELCTLPRLADIYVTTTTLVNERNESIPHVWVTLHYDEYSCQYYVREADFVTTKKNCYNTW